LKRLVCVLLAFALVSVLFAPVCFATDGEQPVSLGEGWQSYGQEDAKQKESKFIKGRAMIRVTIYHMEEIQAELKKKELAPIWEKAPVHTVAMLYLDQYVKDGLLIKKIGRSDFKNEEIGGVWFLTYEFELDNGRDRIKNASYFTGTREVTYAFSLIAHGSEFDAAFVEFTAMLAAFSKERSGEAAIMAAALKSDPDAGQNDGSYGFGFYMFCMLMILFAGLLAAFAMRKLVFKKPLCEKSAVKVSAWLIGVHALIYIIAVPPMVQLCFIPLAYATYAILHKEYRAQGEQAAQRTGGS